MLKASAILPILCLLSLPAFAAQVILTSQDLSPPTAECNGIVRPCRVPAFGPDPQDTGLFVWSHGGKFPSITVSLAAPTQVKITYSQIIFLNSESAVGQPCFSWLPACAAYLNATAIVVGTGAPQLACAPGGFGGKGKLGIHNLDFPAAMGFSSDAICTVTLPAGTSTIYPVESARNGAYVFTGDGEGFLMVEYDDGT